MIWGALHGAAFVVGMAMVFLMLLDVFQSVIVPRPVGRRWRASSYISQVGWRLVKRVAERSRSIEAREDFLGTYAPFALTLFLLVWVGGGIVGLGLMFFALGDGIHPHIDDLGNAFYFAGVTMLTIGYGDFVPESAPTRILAVIGGALGPGLFAVCITFLFSIFAAFQKREVFVVRFGERAGSPPSGVQLLTIYGKFGMLDRIGEVFSEAQTWCAEVMESHLAYPILMYFRSSHDYQSWIGTFGAAMDAANLLLTACEGQTPGEARFMLKMGRHFIHDFNAYFDVYNARTSPSGAGVERVEFEAAHAKLAAAGIPMRDPELAYQIFSEIRSTYAPPLNAAAHWLQIPPAQWIGDRSAISKHSTPIDPRMLAMIDQLELGDTTDAEHRTIVPVGPLTAGQDR